jgi:hypothetical protein
MKSVLGLFKVEWTGKGMSALNSKTYIGWNDQGEATKVSHKGVSRVTNTLTPADYKSVLQTKQAVEAKNHGFMLRDGGLVQYEQRRQGLTYFYGKRVVHGNSTKPLAI